MARKKREQKKAAEATEDVEESRPEPEDDVQEEEGEDGENNGEKKGKDPYEGLTRRQKKELKQKEAAERLDAQIKELEKDELRNFSVSQSEDASKKQAAWDHSNEIKIEKFSISAGGKTLFQDASLHISPGHRYGVVGPNGMGKTTLLKHIANKSLAIPSLIDVLYVEQEVVADETPAVEAVVRADKVRLGLLEQRETLTKQLETSKDDSLLEVLKKVEEELVAIRADSAYPRARKILYGLGFSKEMQVQSTQSFSGGWRMRISLARALFIEPTLLLLDEPTNHLDLNAVIWLDSYLQQWKKMLLVVSHDQDFLNNVCTDVIHLDDQKLVYYRGNFETFKKMFAQKKKEELKRYEQEQRQLKNLKKGGKSTKQATEKVKRDLAKKAQQGAGKKGMGEAAPAKKELMKRPKEYIVKFTFPEPPELNPPVIEVLDAGFQYAADKPVLFTKMNFGISMDSRMCIVGPNGVGKSTLLNLITGHLEPTTGTVRRNRHLRIGRYNQHFVDQLPMDVTPVQYLQTMSEPERMEYQQCRKQLGRYGLPGFAHELKIKDLSGGQKARVVFSSLGIKLPHILIFDEPTNHLDMESIDALVEAIKAFQGGVVLVSHDARLILETDCVLWVCGNQDCYRFDGDFEDYKEWILEQLEQADN